MLAKKKVREEIGFGPETSNGSIWLFPKLMPAHTELHVRAERRGWSPEKKARVFNAWDDVREAMGALMRYHGRDWPKKATAPAAARGALILRGLIHQSPERRVILARKAIKKHPDLEALFLPYAEPI